MPAIFKLSNFQQRNWSSFDVHLNEFKAEANVIKCCVLNRAAVIEHLQKVRTFFFWNLTITEMPTSGELKSGDFCFITPRYRTTTPPKKKEMRPPPHQINLHAPKSTLRCSPQPYSGKKRRRFLRSSEDFLSWAKVELKSYEDFPMLAQRIGNVSLVHQSILKTNGFLIYWWGSNQTVCYIAVKTKNAFV